jgi:GNAT superfamily N-acetyltransferase
MVNTRFAENESDFEQMKNLCRENYLVTKSVGIPGPCDLEYWRYVFDDDPASIKKAYLYFDNDNKLLAFAWMNEDGTDYAIRAGHESLIPALVSWSEKIRLSGELFGGSIRSNCIGVDSRQKEAANAIGELGYSSSGRRTAVFVYDSKQMDLNEEYHLDQVAIRNVEAGKDLKRRAELNYIAQDRDLDSKNYERLFFSSPMYCKYFDIIAEVEGKAVAFCTGWPDSQTKLGLLEPFGCLKDFRGKGIGRAVVSVCLQRLIRFGMNCIYTTHSGLLINENDDTVKFNNSIGFKEIDSILEFDKEL